MESRRTQLEHELKLTAGASQKQAEKQVSASIDRLVWYAGWSDKLAQVLGSANPVAGPYFNFSTPEPTGVVAAVAPSACSLLGLVSVLLTGGIGLLQLNTRWLAIKEAAVPGLIGLAVLFSTRTRYPLIRTMLYNPKVINVARVHEQLETKGQTEHFEKRLQRATYWLSGTFFFSSAMNYVLAKWIVVSPAGTEAFNDELGRMTLLSYPMIAIP
mgnify:CR=1 FL=1